MKEIDWKKFAKDAIKTIVVQYIIVKSKGKGLRIGGVVC